MSAMDCKYFITAFIEIMASHDYPVIVILKPCKK